MKRSLRLRRLIEALDILVMPGVQDALTARLAERAGFEAITCGGYAATASLLAAPDVSQLGLTELADHLGRICDAVDIPLFADADTGFGNLTNVARAVRAYEKAGVAGLFIEDQIFPKRCGHMPGKAVVPVGEMVSKLKSALDTRRDPDLMIMARTDALAVEGLDAAIERAQIYVEIGADLIFVEAPRSVDQMRRICAEISGPKLANNIEGGLSPVLTAAELEAIGYATVVYPCSVSFTIAEAVERLFADLRRNGTTDASRSAMAEFDRFNQLVGLDDLRRLERQTLDYAEGAVARRPVSAATIAQG